MPGAGGERAAKLRALSGALLRRELIDANERDAHGLLHADDFWPLPFPAQDSAQLLLVRGPHSGFYLSRGSRSARTIFSLSLLTGVVRSGELSRVGMCLLRGGEAHVWIGRLPRTKTGVNPRRAPQEQRSPRVPRR